MHLPQLTAVQWTLALIGALCLGLAKGGFSGIGLFTILLMAEVLPARESTGVVLPLLICGDVLSVFAFLPHTQWPYVRRTLPPAAAGVVLGYFLMKHIPDQVFRPLIGWIVLSMVILQALHRLRPSALQGIPHTRWFGWLMGGWSGVTTMVANAAGPVMTLYLLSVNLPKFEFVGTGAWFFLVINIFKVPFSYNLGLINQASLTFNLVLLPSVLLGVLVGRMLIGIIPQEMFELFLLFFAAAASLRLLWVW
jgi:hypothetical protein